MQVGNLQISVKNRNENPNVRNNNDIFSNYLFSSNFILLYQQRGICWTEREKPSAINSIKKKANYFLHKSLGDTTNSIFQNVIP